MTHERRLPAPTAYEWMHPEVQRVRRNSGNYLRELIDTAPSFRDVDHGSITLLSGGISSAAYLLQSSGLPHVVKFSPWRYPSEGYVLRKWQENGVSVPKIKDHGVVPSTTASDLPVDYTFMEAVVDKSGRPAPTANKILNENLALASVVGLRMGQGLAKIHAIPAIGAGFGSRSAIDEFNTSSLSWNQFIRGETEKYSQGLIDLGYTQGDIEKLYRNMYALTAWDTPSYIHNDPSLGNILVPSIEPVKIKIIDPNPVAGDRHWDLAYLAEREEAARRKSELNPAYQQAALLQASYSGSFRAAYEDMSGQEIDERALLVCQLPRLLKRYAWFKDKAFQQLGQTEGELEMTVTGQMIKERTEKLLAAA